MALAYLKEDACPTEVEDGGVRKAIEQLTETEKKPTSKVLFCLLGVAIIFVLNTVYNFAVAAKGEPVLQTLMKNPVFDFAETAKENLLLRNTAIKSVGVVMGIIHSETEPPAALVGIEVVREGDMVAGSKVVKIYKDRVGFERDGFSWTQRVREKPQMEQP